MTDLFSSEETKPSVKIAALADLHLGFTAYTATTRGRNTREVDVEIAFDHAIETILKEKPDIVTVAGDIFHNLRPTMHALLAFRDGIRRLSDAGIITILISGNHEAPKTASTASPMLIPADLPHVYARTEPDIIELNIRDTSVSIFCVPHVSLIGKDTDGPTFEPNKECDLNILLMHAAVKSTAAPGALPYFYTGTNAIDVGRLAEAWDAILLGDYHDFTRLHPSRSVFYSGSIERTSTNIWIEKAPKGVVFIDTSKPGELTFKEIPTRQMFNINLAEHSDEPPSADMINEIMSHALEDETVKNSIYRLFVPNFPRADRPLIDRQVERRLKGHALHFQLETRADKKELDGSTANELRSGKSLEDAARKHFQDYKPEIKKKVFALLSIEGKPEDLDPELNIPSRLLTNTST
jgi:DNA repair protein SbcD/Mre11